MTEQERKIRFEVAVDIVEDVYKDLCHEPFDVVSKETTRELCDFLINMRKWAAVLGGERSLDDILTNASERSAETDKSTKHHEDLNKMFL